MNLIVNFMLESGIIIAPMNAINGIVFMYIPNKVGTTVTTGMLFIPNLVIIVVITIVVIITTKNLRKRKGEEVMEISSHKDEKDDDRFVEIDKIRDGQTCMTKVGITGLEKHDEGITGDIGFPGMPFTIFDSEWKCSKDKIYNALHYAARFKEVVYMSMTRKNYRAYIHSLNVTIDGKVEYFQ